MRALADIQRAQIHQFKLADTGERELIRFELIRRSQQQPSHMSSHNRGGWRTGDDLFQWDWGPTKWLAREIQARLLAPEMIGWGLVNTRGAMHGRHRHRGSYRWSGVFYLDSCDTKTIFEIGGTEDCRSGELIKITPEPNLLVIFPVDVWHYTETHQSHEPRVTVAFDAR